MGIANNRCQERSLGIDSDAYMHILPLSNGIFSFESAFFKYRIHARMVAPNLGILNGISIRYVAPILAFVATVVEPPGKYLLLAALPVFQAGSGKAWELQHHLAA